MDWLALITQVGLPSAAAIFLGFLLYKQSGTFKDITATLSQIKDTLILMTSRLDSLEHAVDRMEVRMDRIEDKE